jgi:hypothetical protein
MASRMDAKTETVESSHASPVSPDEVAQLILAAAGDSSQG